MKDYLLIFISFILTSFCFSQADFNLYKDRIISTCGHIDSVDLANNIALVDSLALVKVTKGEEEFLLEYGMAYYQKFLHTKSRNDMLISTSIYTICWEKYKNIDALYAMVIDYATFDCAVSRKYIPLLEKNIRKNRVMSREAKESCIQQINFVKEQVCKE